MPDDTQTQPPRRSPAGETRAADAFDRRAAALRANLRRRKAQAREREQAAAAANEEP